MSPVFNPYSEWLGIGLHSGTPTYYELLDLRALESDTAKIEAAYQQQSAKIAAQLAGRHVADAQRVMGELAEARMTLLTPTAKRAYDAALATAGTAVAKDSHTQSSVSNAPYQAMQASAPQPAFSQASSAAGYGQPQAVPQPGHGYGGQGYVGQPAGYPPAYGAQHVPTPVPVYPVGQAYPGWQGQPGVVASAPAPGYVPSAAPQAAASEAPSIPEIRRRRARRRSSPVPAVVGALVVLAALGGGWFYYSKRNKTVAVVEPAQRGTAPADQSTGATKDGTRNGRQPNQQDGKRTAEGRRPRTSTPTVQPPAVIPAPTLTPNSSANNSETPGEDRAKPDSEMPEPGPNETDARKPARDTPDPEKPKREKSAGEQTPDTKASEEEAAAVAKLLKAARAALADRDVSKAQDLLAEATIEATAPDTTAEVSRVELLASYVEMFWDAVRQTLPKIALEDLEINGTMLAVVEADENHLIVRAEGRNREYTLKKLPHDIAYYLANRWLAPADPLRNLVLASFEIVDPKGDRDRAQSLLDAAASARLKVDPLRQELKRVASGP